MVQGLSILLLFHWLGELFVRLFHLPMPGPVAGFAGLLLALLLLGGPTKDLEKVSSGLLQHLSLLFVPAGVGVIIHLHRLRADALPLSLALVLGTCLALVATAAFARLGLRKGQA